MTQEPPSDLARTPVEDNSGGRLGGQAGSLAGHRRVDFRWPEAVLATTWQRKQMRAHQQ